MENMDEIETKTEETEAVAVESNPAYTQLILPGAILLAALIISGTLFYTRGGGTAQIGNPNTKPEKVEVKVSSSDHMLGDKDAKIEIVEFSDFQCPFCRSFWSDALVQIKREYVDTGKAVFVYKHYPLSFHPAAQPAAEASECAAEQGKFWEFHDKIFQEQEKLGQGTITFGDSEIKTWAAATGLDMGQFNQCFDGGKYAEKVSEDLSYGSQLGVSGTPTVFINGQKIVGAQPFANFKAIIDPLLK